MRAPDLADLDAAARVLLAQPRGDWPKAAAGLIAAAHCSDRIRKRLFRPVAGRGTGSLLSEAMQMPRARVGRCDPDYCAALAVVLAALEDWRAGRGRQLNVQLRQRGRVGSAFRRSSSNGSPQSVQ